jgi:hypothetical protein
MASVTDMGNLVDLVSCSSLEKVVSELKESHMMGLNQSSPLSTDGALVVPAPN